MASKKKPAKQNSHPKLKELNTRAYRAPAPSSAGPPPPKSSAHKNGFQPNGANAHGIPDWRLEKPQFKIVEVVADDGTVRYEARGNLDTPVPPIRESRYLNKEKALAIYRFMHLNRRMEIALENLYKQGKVVGGVYFGLGQEGCSVASTMALREEDWFAPMIRNQGALLVRGWRARDVMMQYMAKAGSPTRGKDANTHFGDIYQRNQVAPISTLGDLIPVLAGVALGARMQGRNIACLTWVGDGGQSTGVTYEGFNFAAVQKLGVVLIVENNAWAYATPTNLQFAVEDLADRSIAYGVPGVIVDGTDPNQVYDATHEACERARRGHGPTLIEAKMMRMKGHAIHDAAQYVPEEVKEYWRRRDPIARYEKWLMEKSWLTAEQNQKLIEEVERELDEERDFAEKSPMPEPDTATEGVWCDGCHEIKPKYGEVKVARKARGKLKESEAAAHLK
jgi:pyruvate dehydrogenase E1 component alpha subunit/2-oxoisovalerate dehydrogenase E1 component alpha subunit